MARTRLTVTSPADLARALLQARDELGAAKAALSLTRAIRPAAAAAAHVAAACELLDDAQAAIVATWLRSDRRERPRRGRAARPERYAA